MQEVIGIHDTSRTKMFEMPMTFGAMDTNSDIR